MGKMARVTVFSHKPIRTALLMLAGPVGTNDWGLSPGAG